MGRTMIVKSKKQQLKIETYKRKKYMYKRQKIYKKAKRTD